jgi:hypothetical protein
VHCSAVICKVVKSVVKTYCVHISFRFYPCNCTRHNTAIAKDEIKCVGLHSKFLATFLANSLNMALNPNAADLIFIRKYANIKIDNGYGVMTILIVMR